LKGIELQSLELTTSVEAGQLVIVDVEGKAAAFDELTRLDLD